MASLIFPNASGLVLPWLTQPGIEGHSTTQAPSSSRSTVTRNFIVVIVSSVPFPANSFFPPKQEQPADWKSAMRQVGCVGGISDPPGQRKTAGGSLTFGKNLSLSSYEL
jgi:hypothetical protein